MSRESDGILFSAVCGHCGQCWDDHENPYQYGWTDERMKEVERGFRSSLYYCSGFRVRRVDIPDIVTVCAKRLFLDEPQLARFWEHPGVRSKAYRLLKQNRRKWEDEDRKRSHSQSMHSDRLLLIGVNPKTGTSQIIDMGS